MKDRFRLEWKYPRILLWISSFIVLLVPVSGMTWYLIRFNIPFVHSGDKLIINGFFFLCWVAYIFFVFGWRVRDEE